MQPLHDIDAQSAAGDRAARLRVASGLRTPDALQAACALSLQEPVRFMTNDAAFRRVAGLDVLLVE